MTEKQRLDSWKEIADYLGKSVKTCRIWEKKFELPVHRINKKSARARVFAYKKEIDEWFQKRTE
jgi:hypothetical protein